MPAVVFCARDFQSRVFTWWSNSRGYSREPFWISASGPDSPDFQYFYDGLTVSIGVFS